MNVRIAAEGLDQIEVEAWGRRYILTRASPEPTYHGDGTESGNSLDARAVDEGVRGLIASCAHEVAARTGVSVVRMRGSLRSEAVACARIATMWLAHSRYGVHETELGIFFRRHRTTVIYAVQSVANALRLDPHGAPSPDADRWLLALPAVDVARARARKPATDVAPEE